MLLNEWLAIKSKKERTKATKCHQRKLHKEESQGRLGLESEASGVKGESKSRGRVGHRGGPGKDKQNCTGNLPRAGVEGRPRGAGQGWGGGARQTPLQSPLPREPDTGVSTMATGSRAALGGKAGYTMWKRN